VTWREQLLIAVSVAAIVATFLVVPPIAQDPGYHGFADTRTFFRVANFWNVVSNLPFLLVGGLALARAGRLPPRTHAVGYVVFSLGVLLVAAGSAWYHRAPSTQTLVWDRLPMTIAFMAFFALSVGIHVSARAGRLLLWPALASGAGSVAWWYATELQGHGDLRPYGLVQFLPMVLILVILLLHRVRGTGARYTWAALAAYAGAKLAERYDAAFFNLADGALSGHSVKHALAALAAWWLVQALTTECPKSA
jgi:Ceramidase